MRTVFTRRVLITLISGLLTLAVVAAVMLSLNLRQPQRSAQVVAASTATQSTYQLVSSPTSAPTQATATPHSTALPTTSTSSSGATGSTAPTTPSYPTTGRVPGPPVLANDTPTPTPTSGPPAPNPTATSTSGAATPTATPTTTPTPTPTSTPTPTTAGVDDGMAISPTSPAQQSGVGSLYMNITLQNTGTTTWTAGAAYTIVCVSNCGTSSFYQIGVVPPGGTKALQLQMLFSAPFSSSVTDVQWRLEDNGTPFGSPINLRVTQTVAVPIQQDAAPWCSNQSIWTATQLANGNTVTCTSSGTVLQTPNWTGPGLWLSNPPANFNSTQYRLQVHVHYSAVSSSQWVTLEADATNSSLCPDFHADIDAAGDIQTYTTATSQCAFVHHTWLQRAVVGQDVTLGLSDESGYCTLYVNQLHVVTCSIPNGGSPALSMGSSSGQSEQVTLSNFVLYNDVNPYTTYVLF